MFQKYELFNDPRELQEVKYCYHPHFVNHQEKAEAEPKCGGNENKWEGKMVCLYRRVAGGKGEISFFFFFSKTEAILKGFIGGSDTM